MRQVTSHNTDTMIGAQASNDELQKILAYVEIGKAEGAKTRHRRRSGPCSGRELSRGLDMQPTIFEVTNNMRIFQEEIFGPRRRLLGSDGYDDVIAIANDTLTGWAPARGPAYWNRANRAGRDIQAGGVWTKRLDPLLPGARTRRSAVINSWGIGLETDNALVPIISSQQTKNLSGQ